MTIRPLQRDEIEAAVALAARAFADDPLMAWLYPDPALRAAEFGVETRAGVRWLFEPLGAAEVDDRLRGLALWRRTDVRVPAWRYLLLTAATVQAVGPRRAPSVLRDYLAFDAAVPKEDHWYLGLLATSPEAQGEGVGSALLRHGLDRADRDGLPAYLETGTEANVAFYERRGFRVCHEIALPSGGPTHWGMWREPGADRS